MWLSGRSIWGFRRTKPATAPSRRWNGLVSLATVLAMEPEALLLDEPTNGLDPEARQRIIGVLKTIPTARIIISHDWDFLAETSSEYLTVVDGRLTDAAPSLAHAHFHVHPLGGDPHEH